MGNAIKIAIRNPGSLSGHEKLRAKNRFHKVTGTDDDGITPEQFNALLGPYSTAGKPCAEALFKYVDSDHSGSLCYKEISNEIQSYRSLATPEAKLRVLFAIYDQDHDGKISSSEIADAMRVACQVLPAAQLNRMAQAIIEEFDVDKDGFLNFDEFSALIRKSGFELNLSTIG